MIPTKLFLPPANHVRQQFFSYLLPFLFISIVCKSPEVLINNSFLFRDRLSASDMLHVRKVIEHVYEKVLGNDNSGNSNNHADKEPTGPPTDEELAELGALAEARVELLCHDQVGVSYHLIR